MLLILMMSLIIILISSILLIINSLMSMYMYTNREKKSTFECGFEIFQNMRLPFSIHFYFLSILFLIFDVEIIFFYSMIKSSTMLNYKMWLFSSMIILMILHIGLEYEKTSGPLKWLT